MKTLLFVVVTTFVTGCSGLVQTGSVSQAYETYQQQDYPRTLELISLAKKVNTMTPELDAELTFLKAETYAQMGMTEKSEYLYRSLATKHKDTEFGYLAEEKIKGANFLN